MQKAGLVCVLATVVLLSSCVGIDSRLSIHQNGSGILSLTYRVSKLVVSLGNPVDGKGAIPLPLSRDDFERSLTAAGGKVRLTKFDRSDDKKDVTIHVELAFDSVDALAQIDAFQTAQIRFSSVGGTRTFSELVARAPREPISDDTLRMIDAFFGGYDLSFTVEVPQPVKTSSVGSLSSDKRALTYTTSIGDIVRSKNDIVLSMSW